MSTTLTTNVRNGGRWLLAAAVVFVAGFALALFVEPGGWMTELGVALPATALANEMLTAARGLGLADKDCAAIFNVLAALSGVAP